MNAVDLVRRTLAGANKRGAGDIRGPSGTNVNGVERAVSVLIGGMLVARGLKRRSLGGAMVALAGGGLLSRGITGHSTVYQKLNLHTAGGRTFRRTRARDEELEIMRAITIGKPADELYRLWRDPQIQPQIMADFADVAMDDKGHAHWAVRAPMGRRIEWDSEIVEERAGEMLRWQTREGAELPNEGSVRFRPAPGNRGTEVHLHVKFSPPGAMPVKGAMKLLGFIPKQMAYKALWRFKALAETGQIPSIKGQPAGRNGGRDS
jgi:uncharacterized membrane protein